MPKEPNILRLIADNPALSDAVKTLFLKQFDIMPKMDAHTDDIVLGQFLRARLANIEAVENIFREIAQHKTVAERKPPVNQAR